MIHDCFCGWYEKLSTLICHVRLITQCGGSCGREQRSWWGGDRITASSCVHSVSLWILPISFLPVISVNGYHTYSSLTGCILGNGNNILCHCLYQSVTCHHPSSLRSPAPELFVFLCLNKCLKSVCSRWDFVMGMGFKNITEQAEWTL